MRKWHDLRTLLFILSLGTNTACLAWTFKLLAQLRQSNSERNRLRESLAQNQTPNLPDSSQQTQAIEKQQANDREQLGNLQSQLDQLCREHEERISQFEAENHDLKDRCTELEYLFQQQKCHHDEVVKRHSIEMERLLNEQNKQLEARGNGQLASSNQANEEALKSQQLEFEQYRQQQSTQITVLNEQLSSLRLQSAELHEELALAITKVEERQKQLSIVSSERDSLRMELDRVNEQNKQLIEQSRNTEDQLRQELEQIRQSTRSERESLHEQLVTEQNAAVMARQQSEQDLQKSLNNQAALRDEIEALNEKLHSLQLEHDTLRTRSSVVSHRPAVSSQEQHSESVIPIEATTTTSTTDAGAINVESATENGNAKVPHHTDSQNNSDDELADENHHPHPPPPPQQQPQQQLPSSNQSKPQSASNQRGGGGRGRKKHK